MISGLILAEAKARWVADRRNRSLVIGADQMLVCGDTWLDKPSDLDEAHDQLKTLRGRTHELITTACAVQAGTLSLLWHTVSRPQLTMRKFSDEFLDDYNRGRRSANLRLGGCFSARRQRGAALRSHRRRLFCDPRSSAS
jgi:predicted house-cleaning NTP pyrophosphatase (Maf/HAM1 superfamily)